MNVRLILGLLGLSVLGGLYVLVVYLSSAPVDEGALAERIMASQPTWASYQEDIKGQIGARPVAEWKGRVVSADRAADGTVSVRFELEGPWAARRLALPVLLRDPELRVLVSKSAVGDGAERVYRFTLEGTGVAPWVEIQYPHHTERIPLGTAG